MHRIGLRKRQFLLVHNAAKVQHQGLAYALDIYGKSFVELHRAFVIGIGSHYAAFLTRMQGLSCPFDSGAAAGTHHAGDAYILLRNIFDFKTAA